MLSPQRESILSWCNACAMHCFKIMSLGGCTDVAGGCIRHLEQSLMGKIWRKDRMQLGSLSLNVFAGTWSGIL